MCKADNSQKVMIGWLQCGQQGELSELTLAVQGRPLQRVEEGRQVLPTSGGIGLHVWVHGNPTVTLAGRERVTWFLRISYSSEHEKSETKESLSGADSVYVCKSHTHIIRVLIPR